MKQYLQNPRLISSLLAKHLLMLLFVLLAFTQQGRAQAISITTYGTPLTEDFNSLANTAATTHVLTIPGWAMLEVGTNANTTYRGDNGNNTAGDVISYGIAAGNTERALGGLQSGSNVPTFGVNYVNNTGFTLNSITVSYTGEQWRCGTTSRVDRLDFQYSTDATSLSSGAWSDENTLDFTAPSTGPATGLRDGNDAANKTALNATISGLSIPNGATFWIRWNDFNGSGSDDGLSVDDFSLTANCDPPTAFAGNDFHFCAGSAAQLAGSIGGNASTVTWSASSPGGTFSPNANALNATFTPSDTSVHSYTLTLTTDDPAGDCVAASDDVILTLDAPPTIVSGGGPLTSCPYVLNSLQVSVAGSANAITWSGSPGLDNAVNDYPDFYIDYTPDVSEIGTSFNLIATTNANGACPAASVAYNVTVFTAPVPTVTGATQVCPGQVVTYTTEAGKVPYDWSVYDNFTGGAITANGTSNDNTATVTWGPTPGGVSVIVNYTDANGCVAGPPTDYAVTIVDPNDLDACTIDACSLGVVTHTPNPVVASATSGNATCQLCADGTLTIGVISGGAPAYIITPASPRTGLLPGDYCFTVTDQNGCSDTACATVGYAGATCAVVAAIDQQTAPVCLGGNNGSARVTLSGIGTTATGTYSLDGGTPVAYATNPFTITGLTAGSHTVVATTTTPCISNTANITIGAGTDPNDNNLCTTDGCDPITGVFNTPLTGSTDDGNACTTGESCNNGTFVAGTAVPTDDSNICTTDGCDPITGVYHTPLTGATDDGNACTTGESCNNGTFVAGTAVVCNDNNPCTDDTCDPILGCVYTNDNSNTYDDGNACTTGDFCLNGVATSGTATVCNDNNPCTDDTCDPILGCVYTNDNSNTYDDGNACTTGDFCLNGVATSGPATVCNDNNPCTDDTCDPILGCVYTNDNSNTYDDGNACTTGDFCLNGVATSGPATVCNDNNPCTDDTCDPILGCVYTNDNSNTYDDGNACTTGDFCLNGVATSGPATVCNDNNPCTDDTCDPILGCVYTNDNSNTYDDGNACTTGDFCLNGVATSGPATVCNDNNPCTDDTCDPILGCVYTNDNSNTYDDGNACTTGDFCLNGVATSGPATVCNDNNPCTDDTCDPILGCVYTNDNSNTYDDGNACTTGDFCLNGVATSGPATVCNDNNPCTDDTCDPILGCVYTNDNSNTYDDGNACTTGDFCLNGVATSGPATVCNDNNPCTDDTCDPILGCVYTNDNSNTYDDGNACTTGDFCLNGVATSGPATVCNDNNPCTDDTCDPILGCVYTNDNSNTYDDGNACTTGDFCLNGVATSGPATVCNDNNPCTDDTCDPILGCVYTNDNSNTYDDGNACTTGDFCLNGVATSGPATVCNDNNPCTDDTCDPILGCVYTNDNSNTYDDGNACTTGDFCLNGVATSGPATVCNDNNPCTDDTCDPILGCVYTNDNSNTYDDGNACTTGESCNNGTIVAGTPVPTDDNNICTTDGCDPGTGDISHTPVPDGTSGSSDGLTCTVDICSNGNTVHNPVVTDDGNPCTMDGCIEPTGVFHTPFTAPAQPGAFTAGPANVCQGQNAVVYTVPFVSGVTYSWSYTGGTGATIIGTSNSVVVNFSLIATSGSLEVTASNGCGTSAARTKSITTNDCTGGCLNPVNADAGVSNDTICENQTLQLGGSVSGAYTTITWSSSGDGSFAPNANDLNAIYTPGAIDKAIGTVILTLTAGADVPCVPASDNLILFLYNLPITSTTTNSPVCEGQALDMGAGGGVSFAWTGPNGFTNSELDTTLFPVTLAQAGTYYVLVTDTNGCSALDSVIAVVNPLTPVTFNAAASYCINTGLVLLTGSQAPNGTFSGLGVTDNGNGTATFDPTVVGIGGPYLISYEYTNGNGCTSVSNKTLVVYGLPITSTTTNSPVCQGQALDMGAGGGVSYSWTGPNGFTNNDLDTTLFPAIPAQSGTYYILITDTNGCTGLDSIIALVYPVTPVSFSIAPSYCINSAPVLLVGNLAPLGTFSGLGVTDHGNGTATFDASSVAVGGPYLISYEYTNGNGCYSVSNQTVVIYGLPITSTTTNSPVCEGGALDMGAGGGITYSWTGPNGFTNNDLDTTLYPAMPNQSGTYYILITDTNGCTGLDSIIALVYPVAPVSFSVAPYYCLNSAPVLLTGSQAPNGTFSGIGVTDNGNGTAYFDPSVVGVGGPYLISYEYYDGNNCYSSVNHTVLVYALPITSTTTNSPVCQGEALDMGAGGGISYAWTGPNGFTNSDIDTTLFPASPIQSGKYYVLVTDTNGCTALDSVIALVNPTYSVTGQPVVACDSYTMAWGEIVTVTGNYDTLYASVNGCDSLLTIHVTINYSTASFDTVESCVHYLWNGTDYLSSGDYTALFANGNAAGCDSTANLHLTIYQLPVASISYLGSPFCAVGNGSVSLVGQTGGAYSSSAGLVINSTTGLIDLDASTAGTYTVKYVFSDAHCTDSTSTNVTIIALPVATISYAGNPFCATGTAVVSQTGQIGGSYSSTAGLVINPITGEIDLVASTAGNYIVTYSFTDGVCNNSTTTNITINALPIASISYTGSPFCATGTANVIRTGQVGGTYSASPAGLSINSGTGQINLTASAGGTYIITYSFTNGICSNTTTTSVTINALPIATINYAGNPFCRIGATSVTQTGQIGGTYTSTAGLVINNSTGQINLGISSVGTYTVTYSFNNGVCSNTATASVTINALPTATISYPGNPFCATGVANVSLVGQAGGTYSSTAGLVINSATGQIDRVLSTPGTYLVTYLFNNANCSNTTTTSVTINALPTATISYTGSPFCAAGLASVNRIGQAGGTYSALPAGLSINASTGELNLLTSAAGTYTITYSFTNGICPNTTTTSVTVIALPVANISYIGTPFCPIGTASVTQTGLGGGTYSSTPGLVINSATGEINLVTSTPGTYTVTYSFTDGVCPTTVNTIVTINPFPTASISYVGSPFCADGIANVNRIGQAGGTYSSTPGLDINSSTGQINLTTSLGGTYLITYAFSNLGCNNSTTTSVTINSLPIANITYPGNPFCARSTANVNQSGQQGGTYSSSPAGLAIDLASGQIDLGASAGGVYTVTYSFTNGICPNTATTSVTINPLPVASISYAGTPFCAIGLANVTQTGTAGGTYSSTVGLVINSSSGQINLGASTAGSYTITYDFSNGTCDNSTTTNIDINPIPTATINYAGNPFCAIGTANVTQTGQGGGTYSATPAGLVIDLNTGQINRLTSLPGTYTVTYSFSSLGCVNTAATSVTINALPTATISYSSNSHCVVGLANVIQTGQGGGTYSSTVGLSLNSATGQINLGTSTPGAYVITYSFTNGICPNTTTTSITLFALPTATIAYPGSPFCASGVANVVQTGQIGGTYSATPAGLSINSTTGQINRSASAAGTYTITYLFNNANCSNTTSTSVTILALPTATISYPNGGQLCKVGSAAVTRVGQTGGTYTSSPAGLSIFGLTGTINLAASTAGTYTVTYSFTNGTCPNTATTSVTVNALPTANISYPVICKNSPLTSVIQTGQSGGTYTSSPAGLSIIPSGANAGQINPAASTAGTYTVTYSFSSSVPCNGTTSVNVAILALPTASINYNPGTFCPSGTKPVNRTGTTGGTYSSTPGLAFVSTSTGEINLAASTPGTYTVTYTFSNANCSNTTTASITINNPDDGNACTIDACDPLTAIVTHTPVDPNDNNVCTIDACDPVTGISNTPISVDDNNVCTTDACDPISGPSHTPVSVDDNNVCTTDACDPINGISHTPISVDDNNVCTTDACDPMSGPSHTPINIDDNNACTADACDPVTGPFHTTINPDDNNVCTIDACDPITGVSNTPISVDDNNACTVDACDPVSGPSHTPVNTDDNNVCTTDGCDPITGVSHTPISIDDNNACTADACDPVNGVSHTPISVDDNNVCTTDACDPISGVSHTPISVDDNNVCTTDACDPISGPSHTPINIDDNNACTADACDPVTGPFHTTINPDDNNVCTIDACDPISGVSNTPISVDDNNACTVDACDPVSGPSHTPVDPNDNNVCTTDGCDPGTGIYHTPINIDDNNACTADACDPVNGVSHTPISVDDNNVCTTDACDPISGVSHTPISVDDNDVCTADACDPISGPSHTPISVDDNNVCTTDACDPVNGISHTPISVDDNNVCTTDACDPISGPSHTPISVDDNDVCTADACDPISGPSHTPISVDDNDVCTADACDPVNGISHTPISVDDNDVCTADACDPITGPSHTLISVDDNNVCTTDACDPISGPSHTPISVDDNNVCTADACDPLNGVSHTPISVDDNNVCTTDACDPVNGISHAPISVDDNNVCTADACDPISGPSHTPISVDDNNVCTTDACDPINGPSHTPISVDDNNVCTTDACDPINGISHTLISVDDNDVCTADACDPITGPSHTPISVDDNNVCTTDACDPISGPSHTPISVDDNDVCTADVCDPINGVSHTPISVDDNNVCTIDACDPITGPSHTPISVDDNNVCTTDACDPISGPSHTPISVDDNDVCTADACDPINGVSHTPISVDDNNVCTIDACDPITGPSHTPISVDDNNVCTTDACDPISGPSHTPISVDDNDVCTADACDPVNGVSHTPISVDDNNVCTTDACDPLNGVSHTPISVDDNNVCTTDACDPVNGVSHTPISVDDNNVCTIDACDPISGPIHTPISVDDNDVCTADACDPVNGVSHTPISVDDNNVCTIDACDPISGPIHTPISVDDNNVCTTDACDPISGPSHTPISVDDNNVCTTDACDPINGISHTPISVDDNDVCTADACDPVNGPSHTPISVDDNDVCTTDACDPVNGVSHTPINIDDNNACTIDACDPITGPSHTPIVLVPGPITGPTVQCLPNAPGGAAYSIPAIPGVNYFWSVPTGMTISIGQNTNAIQVYWTNALNKGITGPLCVTVSNACGSVQTCVILDFQAVRPVQPNSISGPVKVCPGDDVNYSVALVERATGYIWVVPVGMTITAGQGTNMISVSVNGSYTGGAITVSASNACGASPVRLRNVLLNNPTTPGVISGPASGMCITTGAMYSIAPVANAVSYLWTVTAGGTIVGANTGTSIKIDWTNFVSATVSVVSINACGTSAPRTLNVIAAPGTPGVITGSIAVCANGTYPYSVNTVTGAVTYNWTAPSPATISPQGSKNVSITYGSGTGTNLVVSVSATNSCGTGASRLLTNITIANCPKFGDESNSLPMTVYPNPAKNKVNVSFNGSDNMQYNIRILDMSGRLIYNIEDVATEGNNQREIDLNTISTGVYLLMLQSENKVQQVRLVIE